MGTYERFLETEILTADPLALVRMLYRGAIEATGAAREHLAAGRIAERVRQVAKAQAILHELNASLNPAAGGELATNLSELYDYMQRQLNAGNLNQQDAPFAEVETLLRDILSAWQDISTQATAVTLPHEPGQHYVPLSLAG